jgi:glycosyltransferase involved in cell wall biosynthesis
MVRLAYLVSHPIQYQAPLLRLLAQEPQIYLKVFFGANTAEGFRDREFGAALKWDVPLLEGYQHEFLPALASRKITTVRPLNWGIGRRLKRGAFDVLWVHGYTRLASLSGILAAKRLGLKVMVRDEANGGAPSQSVARAGARRLFYAALGRVADAFLAIGTLNREHYRRLGIAADRIFSVPYAVDNAFFRERAANARPRREELRRELGLADGRSVILFSGKLVPRKGPLLLAEAYRQLSRDGRSEPEPYLLFAGDGELRGAIEKMAADLGWRSMRVLGFKNQTELPALYDLCDLFVLPSFHEPWGLVVNEVMNAAKPVIVSDRVGCSPDLVRPGINGFVFRASDAKGLKDALSKVLNEDGFARRMGQASKAIIEGWSFKQDLQGLKAALQSLGYDIGSDLHSKSLTPRGMN